MTTSPYFMFLHSRRWLPDVMIVQRIAAAARHGCRFIYERDQAAGKWVSYVKAPIQGPDADQATVRAVLGELGLG